MSFWRLPVLLLAAAVLLCALMFGVHAGSAQELLRNGDLENGLSDWSSKVITATGCTPRSGSGAMAVNGPVDAAPIQQTIDGPFDAGTYTLTGWAMADGGTASVVASLTWLNEDGDSLDVSQSKLIPGSSYAAFSASLPFDSQATALQVRLNVTLDAGRACLDDLSVEGPPPATPTPPVTDTPALPATNTPTAPGATSTATSATQTPTPRSSDTATPRATATLQVSATPGPGLVFLNGDFSNGLYGWQKYGGSLSASGGTGVLSSDSSSTKWAYETVAVDASRFYEFAASLKPDDGVESASLRISWYASGDGTGSALDTTDSTSKIAGPAASYESVTTGSVAPPSSARSARLRVMLAPSGDAAATLYFDDVSFAEAAAPSATPQPSASPTSTSKPSLTDTPKAATRTPAPGKSATVRAAKTQQAIAAVPADDPDSWDVTGTPDAALSLSEVDSARRAKSPAEGAAPLDLAEESSDGGSGVPVVWLIGAGMLIVGLAGAYLQEKRRR